VLVYVWQHVHQSFIWMHIWVPALMLLWIALDGLWAFLSNNFWDVMGFNDTVENWLFAAFDICFTATAFIGLSLMYAGAKPSEDAAVYPQYSSNVTQRINKKMDSAPGMYNRV